MTTGGVLVGCAAGGLVAGPLLDRVAARVTVVRRRADAAGAQQGPTPAPTERGSTGGPTPTPTPVPVPPTPALTTPVPTTPVAAAVASGGLLALAAVRVGAVPELPAYCVLLAGLVAVSIIDFRVGLVPRRVLYPTLAVTAGGLVAASVAEGRMGPLAHAAIGGVGAFALFAAVWWLYPKGMGFGDVRMAGVCGMALGWLGFTQLYVGFLAAFVLGLLLGLGNLAVRRTTRFPFAPALAAGTAVGILWGGYLGNLWLHPG